MDRRDVRARQLAAMSESVLQGHVIGLATWLDWHCYHTHDSRRSQAGFPDLTMVRENDRVLFVELKTERGKVTQAQQEWIDALSSVATLTDLLEVHVWRPRDMDEIERVLKRRRDAG